MNKKNDFFYEYLHEQQYIEQKTNEINTVDKAFLNYMEWNLLGAHLFIPLDSLCAFFHGGYFYFGQARVSDKNTESIREKVKPNLFGNH